MLPLYRSSGLQILIQVTQDYKFDLLAVQEVTELGTSILEKKDCTIYSSYNNEQHIYETGFIVSTHIR